MIDINTIGVGVETREVVTATRELDKFGKSADTASRKADGLTSNTQKLGKESGVAAVGVGKLAIGLGAVLSVGSLARTIDEYTKFNAQLKLATRSQTEYTNALADVNRIANTAQASLSSIGTLYARLNNSLRDLGVSQTEVAKITENVGLALKVSGATATESASAMLQLSQAFGSGVLRGEEFNAVNEAAPALMRSLAESIGVPIGALRELASDGKITSDVLAKAFGDDKLLSKFREQAKEVQTISGAFQVFKNSITNTIGELDKATGASKLLAKAFVFLGENAGIVIGLLSTMAVGLGAIYAPSVLAGLAALVAFFATPVGIIALIVGATAAAVTFGLKSSEAFAKSAEEARKLKNALSDKGNGAPIDVDGLKQYRELEKLQKRNAFLDTKDSPFLNNERKRNRAEINRLKSLLGLSNSQTPNGYVPTENFAPNFGVTKKDGQGGYDARQNNQAELDKQYTASYKSNIKERSEAQQAQDRRDLFAIELEYTAEMQKYEKLLINISDVDDAKEKAYKEELKRIAILQDAADENYKAAQKAFKDVEDEKRREFQKTIDGINQTFREGFASLVNGGKGSWKAFTQSLFTTFKTTVADQIYRLFAQPFVVKLVASILGVGASGSASAGGVIDSLTGGSSGGIGGLFSTVKDFFSGGNGSIISAIEGFGSTISNGLGGIRDTIGGFLGQNASLVANLSAFSGAALSLLKGDIKGAAFQGAGAGIGLALGGPIGGAIGSFLGGALGSAFGSKERAKIYDSTSRQVYENGGITSLSNASANSGRRWKPLGAESTLNELNMAFAQTLGGFLSEFGISDKISSNANVGQRKKTAAGYFSASFGNGSYTYQQGGDQNAQQAFEKLAEAVLSEGIISGIKQSALPAGIKKFFDELTTKEQVFDAINTIVGLKNSLLDLPEIFNAVRNAIDTTAYTTSIEALKAQFSATQNFVNLFYSDTEKFNIFTQQLVTQLGSLNKVLPSSRDEYRLLVESINVVDAASRDQYNGLIALAPAMNEYFNLLGQQAAGIDEVNQALADGLNQNLFSTFADYASARASAANGLSPAGFIGERSSSEKDSALALEVKSLREQGANQQTILETIATYLYNMEKIYKQWNGDGLPAERGI